MSLKQTPLGACVRTHADFPRGTRVRTPQGKTATVVFAREYPGVVDTGRYEHFGTGFVRLGGYERGLGGPYVAIQRDDDAEGRIVGARANELTKLDPEPATALLEAVPAPPITVVVNLTIVVN